MSHHDDGQLPGGQQPGGQQPNDEHFDEVDAVRRFPSEDEWLDLPAPDEASPSSEQTSFADRVMRAREEEQELDAELQKLDAALPNDVLQHFAAPTPSTDFVDATVDVVMNDRRQRWQEMLSRYVAPEPSPAFVSRTLDALKDGDAGQTREAAARVAQPTAGNQVQGHPSHSNGHPSRSNWPVFTLVAAAAAAIFWLLLTDAATPPLELRMADQASPAVAYRTSSSPMSAILARVAHDEEPFALFDEPADGIWLSTTGEIR